MAHFSALRNSDTKSYTISRQRHAVFNFLKYDNSKQDAATTTAQSKRLISLVKNKKLLLTSLSTIWESTDGCAEQYICASALYLLSVMSQCYSIIIDRGISAPGNGKEVVDGLSATRKELVMTETTIYDFHASFSIPAIQKLAFHLPHVRILCTNYCGEM